MHIGYVVKFAVLTPKYFGVSVGFLALYFVLSINRQSLFKIINN